MALASIGREGDVECGQLQFHWAETATFSLIVLMSCLLPSKMSCFVQTVAMGKFNVANGLVVQTSSSWHHNVISY